MEGTKVFKNMSYDLDLKTFKNYLKCVQDSVKMRKLFLRDYVYHHANGRIYVGWRLIADGKGYAAWWNKVNRNRAEISTFEILKRKVKRWVKRLT